MCLCIFDIVIMVIFKASLIFSSGICVKMHLKMDFAISKQVLGITVVSEQSYR